jgi:type I restriction enzyme S subunit
MKRLKYSTLINPTAGETQSLPGNTDVSFVPMEAIGEYGGLDLTATRLIGDIGPGYTPFRDGDVVVAKITPCFENAKGALAAGLSNGLAFGTTELHVLRPGPTVQARFLFYVTMGAPFRRLGEGEMYGAGGQKRVPGSFVENLRHPLPPLEEQRAIAAFLDRETAHIDALVAKNERLVGLLQEQRTSLVTRTICKGLDPRVAVKSSGIEQLGDIPSHWDVRRLCHISPSLGVGVVVNPSSYVAVEGLPFLYGSDIGEGQIHASEARRISPYDSRSLPKSELRAGDLVMVRVGAPGVTAVVPPALEGANCASLLIIRRSERFASSWLCFTLNSRCVRSQIEVAQYGAAQEQFNVSHARNFVLAVPPLLEQGVIAGFLDYETARIDALVSKVREAINRLNELRAAIIAAAVTGKVDVRPERAA